MLLIADENIIQIIFLILSSPVCCIFQIHTSPEKTAMSQICDECRREANERSIILPYKLSLKQATFEFVRSASSVSAGLYCLWSLDLLLGMKMPNKAGFGSVPRSRLILKIWITAHEQNCFIS